MDDAGVRLLTPDALRALMAKWDEEKYLLVDVRQPSEYTQGHIPGATLLPLTELQAKVFDLPSDRELVFYCHAGGRSSFAADLAAEAEVTERGVYNLAGGILAWDGRMLPDYPRVQVFDKQKSPAELLMTAMNLEKGAFRFYTHVVEKFGDAPFVKTMSDLSRAEEGHARTIHRFWERIGNGKEPFEALLRQAGRRDPGGRRGPEADDGPGGPDGPEGPEGSDTAEPLHDPDGACPVHRVCCL